jgi:hypothetical protein
MESLVGLKNTQYLCWGNKPYRSLMLLFTLYEPVHKTGARPINNLPGFTKVPLSSAVTFSVKTALPISMSASGRKQSFDDVIMYRMEKREFGLGELINRF